MKLICLQENLNKGLSRVSRAASASTSLPILGNILLEAEKGRLILTATNLEIAIKTSIRSKTEKPGSITIPSQILTNFVSLLANEPISLELVGNDLSLKCKNQTAKIRGIPASEFPLIPKVEKNITYQCNLKDLRGALQQVVFAVASGEARPEISGVLFSFNKPEKGKLTLAATDSYRLAEKVIDIGGSEEERSAIIPARGLQELARIMDEDEEKTTFFVSENQILFSTKDTEFTSRTISGEYPDYQQIIPTSCKTKALLDRENLARIIKASSLFAKTGVNDVVLKFDPKKERLEVSSASTQLGENTSEIKTEVAGEPAEIVFNYRYLLEGLSNMTGENVIIEIVDGANPAVLKPEKVKNYLYIIMPIKQ